MCIPLPAHGHQSALSAYRLDSQIVLFQILSYPYGIGRKLFKKAQESLTLNGLHGMYLWVLKDNPAIGFYRHMGGEICSQQTLNTGGLKIEQVSMVWNALQCPQFSGSPNSGHQAYRSL